MRSPIQLTPSSAIGATVVLALGALAALGCGSNSGPNSGTGTGSRDTGPGAAYGGDATTSSSDSGTSYTTSADAGALDLGDADFVGDGGSADGGGETCNLGSAGFATQNTQLFGMIVYYADGGALPAGNYRVQYVDGCMKYAPYEDWAVQAAPPVSAFWLGRAENDELFLPPGTVGYYADAGPSGVGAGGFADFNDCVAANLKLPPAQFAFDGGQLGVWLNDNPYTDNTPGENGRNPTWSLTLLGKCPTIQ